MSMTMKEVNLKLKLLVNQKNKKDLNQLTSVDIVLNLVTGKIVVLNTEESLGIEMIEMTEEDVGLARLIVHLLVIGIRKRRKAEEDHLHRIVILLIQALAHHREVVIERKK